MQKLITTTFVVLLAGALMWNLSLAKEGEANEGKIFGKVYFNYLHDFSQDRGAGSGQTNRFEFTRIYFGYEKDLNENFSIRVLFDAGFDKETSVASSTTMLIDSGGDTLYVPTSTGSSTSTNFRPFVKNAYLSAKCKMVEGAKWYIGMIGMPFVGVPESSWGYRALYPMAMDKPGLSATGASNTSWGSTADLGIGWKGMWNDMFQLEFAAANGAGFKNPEADMFKLFELRPTVYLMEKALTVSGFVSYETLNADVNYTILEFMAGYDHKKFRVGAEYGMKMDAKSYLDAAGKLTTLNGNVLSAWGHLKATEKLTVLARYDMYEPNADLDDNESSLIIAGLDFHPAKNVRIIPNIQMLSFTASDNPTTTSVDESKPVNTAYLTLEYGW